METGGGESIQRNDVVLSRWGRAVLDEVTGRKYSALHSGTESSEALGEVIFIASVQVGEASTE